MGKRLPNVLWAQSSDKIFFTVDVQDAERPIVKVDNSADGTGTVTFRGKAKSAAIGPEDHEYELDLELFGAVSPEESKIAVHARNVFLLIAKKDKGEEYWPRLTKTKTKQPNVKVDWDKWVEEDDEDAEVKDPSSQFDLSSLGDLNNFSGMGGGDIEAGGESPGGAGLGADDDSDDEELPELESA